MSGALSALGLAPCEEVGEADVVVYNTCCVREHAEERFYGRLGELAREKRARPGMVVVVTGCVAQKDGEKVFRRAPHVDVVLGTKSEAALARLVSEHFGGGRGRICEVGEAETEIFDLPSLRESPVHGWISIMTGCDNFCTYCIVPHVRGRERSRPVEQILDEAARMRDEGVLDVTLLGQNVNSYGRDLYGRPRFAKLLREMDEVGIDRVRFTTSHPKDLCGETLAAVASSRHVCHHIHLPLQSGSTRILERMNRRYTKEDYLSLIGRIRETLPGASISTDVMVGFPGETERDFADTLDVVAASGYDQAFTFVYSPRSGTSAAEMDAQVPPETKRDRLNRLVEVVADGALRANLAYVGKEVEVLVEGQSEKDPKRLSGRTRTNKLVHFEGPLELRHDLVGVRISSAQTWYLEGSLA